MMVVSPSIALLLVYYLSFPVAIAPETLEQLANPDHQEFTVKLVESDRIKEYHQRNYTWPLSNYVPNTPGWRTLMEERFAQVAEIEDRGNRYEGYVQTIHSAFLVPNFTEYGFGLARCTEDLIVALRRGIREGLPYASLEQTTAVINAPQQPLFVSRPDLSQRVLRELLPYAEAWSGLKLKPYRAYGFRLYRNESQLTMHVDKMQTHIISFILHIDSSDDAEPWPIFIEDFQGQTHEVILTPGDMLFYESSKCFHGRPKRLSGSWYSSIFVHYYPDNGWYDLNHKLEAHFAVPPEWSQQPVLPRRHERLEMLGTSLRQPDCPDDWCATQYSVKWSGPGVDGHWIAPTMEKFPLHLSTTREEL